MKKIVFDSYDEMSSAAADIFALQLSGKPDSVLGLATGSTPLGLYAQLVKRFEAGEIDFSRARSFNLDEYYPISGTSPNSYNSFMQENLFSKINLATSRLPDGEAADPVAECIKYEQEIEAAGGIDLQILGIGVNGHIGFNEPSVFYSTSTCLVDLTESTLTVNSRFFGPDEHQPAQALTMGLGTIFNARHIVLLISGENKREIAKKLFEGKIYTDIPACLLLLHPDVTVLMDKDASGS